LESKGFVGRCLVGLIGVVHWKRRVGRCPQGCKIGQVAPLDQALGLQPNQRVSAELKRAACALAVFVPFGEASTLLALLTGVTISSSSIWNWVQEVGAAAQARLEQALQALVDGKLPAVEALDAGVAELPLLVGADGVMVPFRPDGGNPTGATVWHEIKVGIITRLGQRVTQTGQSVTQLLQRRLVAVRGDIEALSSRVWLESVQQGVLTAKTVVWLSDGGRGLWRVFRERFAGRAQGIPVCRQAGWIFITRRRICGKRPRCGWMVARSKPAPGLCWPAIACAMVKLIWFWRTSRPPWLWKDCRRQRGRRCRTCTII
jgi:hypothetical protein